MPEDLGKPISYLVLEPGLPVYSSDGEKIGRVEKVLYQGDADIFDGLVIGTGPIGVLGKDRYVKAEEIEEIFERGVLLKLDAERAKQLPEPRDGALPPPG